MFRQKPIETVKLISQEEVLWRTETILLYVNKGNGLLSCSKGRNKDGDIHSFLLLNDIPLTKWYSDPYDCPTCERLLSAGYGRDKIDYSTLEVIKNAGNQFNQPLQTVTQQIEPLLTMLKTGLYAVSFIPLYPTNGQGDFFWNLTNNKKTYKASCDTYYNFKFASAFPSFLVPTQSTTKFDLNRVEHYRNVLKQGVSLGGIAYYLDGYLCALLDGHHRATAAFLERKEFVCLTIMPVSGVKHDLNQDRKFFSIGGETFDFIDIPRRIVEKTQKAFTSLPLSPRQVEEYISMEQEQDIEVFPQELRSFASGYLDFLGVACKQWDIDLSDEGIEQLLHSEDTENLGLALKVLCSSRNKRAKELALQIGKSDRYVTLWIDAFRYLSSIQSEEIEDFFIHFLVYDEGSRPEVTKIANDYLMQR